MRCDNYFENLVRSRGSMHLILGSQSPRRREILGCFSLPFTPVASGFDEETIPFDGDPIHYVKTLARKKGETLTQRFPNELILTADSVVYCEGKVYNKPRDQAEAVQFLQELGGRWHQVYTGLSARKGDEVYEGHEETRLLFHKLSLEQITAFHQHCHVLDKSGGYTIEGAANLIVSRMEGCYYNVLGLPINKTRELLLNFKVDLWDYLRTSWD